MLAFLLFGALLQTNFINLTGDLIHLEFMRSTYLAQVRARPIVDGQRIVVFNWGGMIWASTGAVYDESGEIALPRGTQSAAWRAQADKTELGCYDYGYGFWPTGGHFYIASFPC